MAAAETIKAALIVVDMQEDFCAPHGSLGIEETRGLALIINELIKSSSFALKIATQDFHPANHVSFASQHVESKAFQSSCVIANPENADETHTITLFPDHCVQNTPGTEIIPEIDQSKLDKVIQKGWDSRFESFSGFGPPFRNPPVSMTEMRATIESNGITHVFVVGVGFDGCVKSTAVDASAFGYETYIVKEGTNTSARSEEGRARTLRELEVAGVDLISLSSPVLKGLPQNSS